MPDAGVLGQHGFAAGKVADALIAERAALGVDQMFLATTNFAGDANGNVKQLHGIKVGPPPKFEPIAGTEFVMDADLVLLAMGFTGPVRSGMIEQLGVKLDARGNVETSADYMSSVSGIFAAGDMRRGQSLVVWAIAEGRKSAVAMDSYLNRAQQPKAVKSKLKRELISA